MLIGDPYKFSIHANEVVQWNDDDCWHNGVLLFYIDGEIFPKQINNVTLGHNIATIKDELMNIASDEELYSLKKEEAFFRMYDITFPENRDIDNDYRYYISPIALSDFDCYVFAVSNGKQVRIMAAKLNYIMSESRHDLNNIDISEAFISRDELYEIIMSLDNMIKDWFDVA